MLCLKYTLLKFGMSEFDDIYKSGLCKNKCLFDLGFIQKPKALNQNCNKLFFSSKFNLIHRAGLLNCFGPRVNR